MSQSNVCLIKNDRLLKIRITTYVSMFTFLLITAISLLNLDFEVYDDLDIRMYAKSKWKLITTWFNLMILAYLPISAYCDWRELQGQQSLNHVEKLNKTRTFLFTSVILPTTVFSDTLFWGIWNKNRTLMMPLSAENVVSIWSQHAMHTATLVFVIIDLIFVARVRPTNKTYGIVAMFGFISVYIAICFHGIWTGMYMYPCFKIFSTFKLCMLCLYVYTGILEGLIEGFNWPEFRKLNHIITSPIPQSLKIFNQCILPVITVLNCINQFIVIYKFP